MPDVFVRTARGAYLSFTRAFGPRSSATLAYRPELTHLGAAQDLFFCVSLTLCAESDIQVLREPHWLAPVTLAFASDRTNSLFAPTRGGIIRFEAEQAARITGSDFAYRRLAAELSGYWEPAPGLVLAGRLRPGWARATGEPGQGGLGLHPQRRFYAGGSNSVRGFAQNRLGPKVLTVDAARWLLAPPPHGAGCTPGQVNDGSCDAGTLPAGAFDVRPAGGAVRIEGNAELRFPLVSDRLRGAAFLDFGQVWSEEGDVDLGELAWTPGVGIRYFTLVGPIRVDVAYNPQGPERLPVITTEVCAPREDGSCGPPAPDAPPFHRIAEQPGITATARSRGLATAT